MPNRPGWSRLSRAANSLQSRASACAASGSFGRTITVEIEVTAVAMPFRSIASNDMAGVQRATKPKSIARVAMRSCSSASQRGGTM